MAEALRKILQVKVTLNGAKPPIWRRLLVLNTTDLSDFHDIIQIAMGWTDSHLHQFIIDGNYYGVPDPDWDDGMVSENGIRIGKFLKNSKDKMVYEYDFGDSWEHRIEVEKVISFTPDIVAPACIGGRKACPPEDVGGVHGYAQFLIAFRDKEHPDHLEFLEWAGEYFDPDKLNMDEVNKILVETHGVA